MHVLNLACVKRELHFLHVSKFSLCKQKGEELTHLPITAMATWRRLPRDASSHNQVCAPLPFSYGRPCFSMLPCSCSVPPPPIQEKQDEEKQTKKKGRNYRGKPKRAQAHYAAAVSSPRRGAFRVSTPPSSARRRTGVSSTGGSVRRRLLLPARARTEMPFRLLKAPPERRRQRS